MKILIKTLGCKANRADSDELAEKLGPHVSEVNNASDRVNEDDEKVGFCVINTCTVTHTADRKSKTQIKIFRKLYPNAKIIAMGCGPRVNTEGYLKSDIDFFAKNPAEAFSYISSFSDCFGHAEKQFVSGKRTRAVIRIQDGCNNFCSYCIIPFARGREKSVPYAKILRDVRDRVKKGFKEIVFTGINIGEWKDGEADIADLITAILDKTSVERLRLSSLEPKNFSKKFERLLTDPLYLERFCPHLHMSLQSGSDRVLKAMRRRYTTSLFKKVAQRMRALSPGIALTTDVIVGFPGETDMDFEETCDFVKDIGFAKIHVFPYSKRAGTKASGMDGQIPEQVKKLRAKKLCEIAEKSRLNFLKSQIGKVMPVLIEQKVYFRGGQEVVCEGFTPNYVKVRIPVKKSDFLATDFFNNIVEARLDKFSDKKRATCIEATLLI